MRAIYGVAALMAATAGPAHAQQLPGTLNFSDVTSSRINQTVPEQASNEKEVEFGDFDNDNDLDVVIAVARSDFSQRRNKLYRNDGGVFNEISSTVPLFTVASGDVARAAFFRDYNQDGWLDIIIVCDNNTAGDPGRTKLWINQHAGGVHTGWTEEGNARLGGSTGGAACSGVSINADGTNGFDLYVGNYPGPSQDTMYFNNGNGFFTQVTSSHVPPDFDYTVDIASADLNGDGKTDLLVSNDFDPNYVYYNNNQGQGTGLGDYRYGTGGLGGRQSLGFASGGENAMEPGDFDGDGDLDVYWNNRNSSTQDVILVNNGNLGNGMVSWTTLTTLPGSVTGHTSRKATVADLNDDGRDDILVMKEDFTDSRPTILRNTTVNGQISFIDWTPGHAFPSGNMHKGWHAAVFDSNGDGDLDIFLGGWNDDHLFEQVPANEVDEDDLISGALPNIYNIDPVAVVGHAALGDVDWYRAVGIGSPALIAVVLNGPADYKLEVLDLSNTVLGSSDRGGVGVEEAVEVSIILPGTHTVRVTVLGTAGSTYDINGDGSVNVVDLIDMLLCFGLPADPGCESEDVNDDGSVNVLDLIELLLTEWGPVVEDYILEVLARSA